MSDKCADDEHDWPVVNFKTGEVSGLCWICGMSAQQFYLDQKEIGGSNGETKSSEQENVQRAIHGRGGRLWLLKVWSGAELDYRRAVWHSVSYGFRQ